VPSKIEKHIPFTALPKRLLGVLRSTRVPHLSPGFPHQGLARQEGSLLHGHLFQQVPSGSYLSIGYWPADARRLLPVRQCISHLNLFPHPRSPRSHFRFVCIYLPTIFICLCFSWHLHMQNQYTARAKQKYLYVYIRSTCARRHLLKTNTI